MESLDGFIVISHRRWSIPRWSSNASMSARASPAFMESLDDFIAKKSAAARENVVCYPSSGQ
ncbi:hypothetical protein [Oribacterium sp. C9]|uniref:hypothetical protein n=1 Tax=Oribacterium sp. C9 TaxID=1943579 RepID=UPI0011156333|nr:hypothetical protein [Oribacterium sp. C9]